MAFSILDYNKQLTDYKRGGSPIGPSKPGFIQGTANQVRSTFPQQGSVQGASTGPGGGGGNPADAGGIFDDAGDAARAENDAYLSSVLSEYDYNRDNLQNQLSSLGRQRETSIDTLSTAFEGVQSQVDKSKRRSEEDTETAIEGARDTASDVRQKNRNTLRALGILNSTAAGELLSRPLNEFDKQRATLIEKNLRRVEELDDFLNQKTAENANAVRQIENQYADLVGRIQNDLRFNDRQRADAVKAANASLLQRLNEIKQSQFNFQQQVNTIKGNIAQGITNLASNYQAPTADSDAILSQVFTPAPEYNPQSVGLLREEDDEERGLLSAYGGGGGASF